MTFGVTTGCLSLLGWVYLAVFNGGFWKPLFADEAIEPEAWPSVDIIVPARNEADVLPMTLASLLDQDYPGSWRVLFVDDHSTDGTGELAQKVAARKNASERLRVVTAPDLPRGWSGKVAAMQAGVTESAADYVLFTDADINHSPGSLRKLVARALERKLDLTSLMVRLHCSELAEQLLIPAFVFFFAMLYPFQRANDEDSKIAAAAGGVMLLRRKALNNIGGLASVKSALIDDCNLAKNVKRVGGDAHSRSRIELTLSKDVKSLRVYSDVSSVWNMIARTAFTQLNYSPALLAGTVLGMLLLFAAPFLLILFGGTAAVAIGLMTVIVMILLYLPMVGVYDLPVAWAVTLPIAAFVYIGATIDSARLYWQGKGGQWKGRSQA